MALISDCSFAGVILLSALANKFRLHKLSRVDQFVMSYGGKLIVYNFLLFIKIVDILFMLYRKLSLSENLVKIRLFSMYFSL